jgi:hypothetical protein
MTILPPSTVLLRLILATVGHREVRFWEKSKLHFMDLICAHYKPYEVAWIDGGDDRVNVDTIIKKSQCIDHFFSREGCSST